MSGSLSAACLSASQLCTCSQIHENPGCPAPSPLQVATLALRRSVNDHPVDHTTWERYRGLLLLLIPLAAFAYIGFFYEWRWRQRLERKRKAFEALSPNNVAPLTTVLGHMVPALQLNDYVFKGLAKPDQMISLAFKDLGLCIASSGQVLDGVTGDFDAGKLVAVLGPSGAGKTTFMNVLCGKATYGNMTGRVFVNGEERSIRDFNPLMGFVPQEDTVSEKLRVRECIRFSAELRNSKATKHSEIQAIIEDVLTVLTIGHIQTKIVGNVEQRGISGGQRKRVNIGLELAASPALLFLDEPTTGLDATTSFGIIHSLKKMTELGITIVMVIHQPRYSLFTLFDTVLLLGKGGRTVYLGSAEKAKPYFEDLGFRMPSHENPADWFMDVLSGQVPTSKKCDFQPDDLFAWWDSQAASSRASWRSNDDLAVTRLRSWTPLDDRKRIEDTVSEAWAATSAGSATDRSHLKRLIKYCSGMSPSDKTIEDFWRMMCISCGEPDKLLASMDEIVEFMCEMLLTTGEIAVGERPSEAGAWKVPLQLLAAADDVVDITPDDVVDIAQGAAKALRATIRNTLYSAGSSVVHRFSSLDEAQMRKIPGPFRQYTILCRRCLILVCRNMAGRAIDIAVILVTSVLLGILHRGATEKPSNVLMFHLTLSVLTAVSCLACFGAERPLFWRERSHGLSGVAYCLAKMTVDSLDILSNCTLYAMMYFFVTDPPIPFVYVLAPCYFLGFVSSAWGYCMSIWLPAENAMLTTSVVMLILNGVFGEPNEMRNFIDGGFMEHVVISICPTRWSVPMFFIEWWKALNKEVYFHTTNTTIELINIYRSSFHDKGQAFKKLSVPQAANQTRLADFGNGHWQSAVSALCFQGAALRIIAIISMCLRNRDKQV